MDMKAKFYLILITCSLVAMSCGCSKGPEGLKNDERLDKPEAGSSVQYEKAEGALRFVQYNVGAFSKYMPNSTDMVAGMLNELDADVCSVNETDSCNTRHNVYQMAELAKAMGKDWKFVFGRAMEYRGGAYGNGVVTKDEILKDFNIALPKGNGSEPRAAVGIETERYVYVSTHIDYSEPEAAAGQLAVLSNTLKEMYGTSAKHVFVGGDFNMVPDNSVFVDFRKDFKMISINKATAGSQSPTKCIDYVFAMNNGAKYEVKKSELPLRFINGGDVKKASDHLPVYVDVILK